MDYLVVGSNGFAQVGDQDYFQKNKIEMKFLMGMIMQVHPIPDEFAHMCFYTVKSFSHEFGTYHEIVLIYDDKKLDRIEEEDEDRHTRFYNWFNDVESWDMESEYYTNSIKDLWIRSIDIDKGEHLRVAV